MRPIEDMTADEALRAYFAEKRRREGPPSLAGIEPDQPKERKPASGLWEELCLLTRGCDPAVLLLMYEASAMYQLGGKCGHHGCYQTVDHEHRDVLGTDGQPLLSGGSAITEPVATPVPPAALARQHGIDPRKMRKLTGKVLEQVAENLGRRRGAAKTHEGPSVADVQALAKEVLG